MYDVSDGLVKRLKEAKSVAVLTGAGISAESGVPTFRGEDGLWKKFSPMELANFDAFMANPELVWEWYNWRKGLISETEPNPGHRAISELENMAEGFTLITQNVDGLHRRAGSRNIIELHGRIFDSYCLDCNRHYDEPRFEGGVPRCECGGMVRPDVVWFGESLDPAVIDKAFLAAARAKVFLSVGTSAQVQPAASLPVIAKQAGAYVVEINPEETPITHIMDEFLMGPSGEILPVIVEKLKKA